MDAEEMKKRTKNFSIKVAQLTLKLPESPVNRIYKSQLIRSATSVGANYRAARRAKSTADFINKLKIVEEELDESLFFFEMINEFNHNLKQEIMEIFEEGEILLRIIVETIKSSRQ